MTEAQYYALLSRATRPTRYEMHWEISLVEAWNEILASNILHGESFMWPDPMLSEAGREMLAVKELRDQCLTEGIGALIDL